MLAGPSRHAGLRGRADIDTEEVDDLDRVRALDAVLIRARIFTGIRFTDRRMAVVGGRPSASVQDLALPLLFVTFAGGDHGSDCENNGDRLDVHLGSPSDIGGYVVGVQSSHSYGLTAPEHSKQR